VTKAQVLEGQILSKTASIKELLGLQMFSTITEEMGVTHKKQKQTRKMTFRITMAPMQTRSDVKESFIVTDLKVLKDFRLSTHLIQ